MGVLRHPPTTFRLLSVLTLAAYRQATRNSYKEWRYHMLLVYNYVLLKMSTWCSKHVEESNILRINNSQCIKLVINVWYMYMVIQNDFRSFNNLSYTIHLRYEYIVAPMDQEILKVFFYVPPLPASIPELKVRIRTTTETITADMLQTFWNELDLRVDVCRITKGAHIEHL